MAERQRRLGALLLEMGVIDEAQLEQALDQQARSGRRLGRVLLDAGLVHEGPLVAALSRQLGIERWDRQHMASDLRARALVAQDVAFKARSLPLALLDERGRETVVLATSDPLAPVAGKVVRSLSERGFAVRWLLAGEGEVENALIEAYEADSVSDLDGEVTVIQGRPERPPSSVSRPLERVGPVRYPEEAEVELVQALDEALGERDGHPVLREEAGRGSLGQAIPRSIVSPDVSTDSLGIASGDGGDTAESADDAVLEIVDINPKGLDVAKEPPSLSTSNDELEMGDADDALKPRWARAARSRFTNWGELVPNAGLDPLIEGAEEFEGGYGDGATPGNGEHVRRRWDRSGEGPHRAVGSEERPDGVALARLSIRKAEVRVGPELPRSARPPERPSEASADWPPRLVSVADADDGQETDSMDDGFGTEPTHVTPNRRTPPAQPDESAPNLRGTLEVPIEAPAELLGPPPSSASAEAEWLPDVSEHAELLEVDPSLVETYDGSSGPKPVAALDRPEVQPLAAPAETPSSSGQEANEQATLLHAQLIRFAAGESLPPEAETDVLRVIVAALLDGGLLTEERILGILKTR